MRGVGSLELIEKQLPDGGHNQVIALVDVRELEMNRRR